MESPTKRITILGLYTTMALTIFMIEAALPTLAPIPGMKLGLANIITLLVMVRFGYKDAMLVLLVRIILASIFAGQIVSLIYSLCGGILCLVAMTLTNKLLSNKYIYITSIIGALFHNTGQILAAFFILRLSGILVYIPYLIICGIFTGLFTGVICHFLNRHLPSTLIK